MRFLHHQIDAIARYVSSIGLVVSKSDRNGRSRIITVDVEAIADMLGATEKLWGAPLPYYLHASKNKETATARTLRDAVAAIEAPSRVEQFLLAGYEDGGLISVSGVTLPFQVGAKPANWWH